MTTDTDTATPDPAPQKKPPRVVVTVRIAPSGKAAIQAAATAAGYAEYTAWIRDLAAAEIRNPRHNLHPVPAPPTQRKPR